MQNKKSLQIMSFTLTGEALAKRVVLEIEKQQTRYEAVSFSVKKECTQSEYVENLLEWTSVQFEKRNAILFIGACGIAVRTIAPFVKEKLTDSAVLVMDEKGQFLIPLLSGHVGGANEFAVQLCAIVGAVPVITTATDVQGCVAIDVFATKHDLAMEPKAGIAKISSKVLEKKKLTLSIAPEYMKAVDIAIASKGYEKQAVLTLIPKEYVIGIGCRKGKDAEELIQFVDSVLKMQKIQWKQVKAIATIEIKKEEKAIAALAQRKAVPIFLFDAETLAQVQGDYTSSEFVKQQVGVDNVCERAAMAACDGGGTLLLPKQTACGMTIAIAKSDWRLTLYEE